MIIDDVEKDHQAMLMRCIDERSQIVGRAVAVLWREG